MMQLTFLMVMFVVVLAWLVLRQPPDELVRRYRLTRSLQWLGLILLAGFAAFWGWWGIAELVFDPSGFIHLLPAVPIALLLYLGWRRPGVVGWGLLLLAVTSMAVSVPFTLAAPQEWSLKASNLLFTLLTIQGPFLFGGVFLILAARLARRLSGRLSAAAGAGVLAH